MDSEGSNNEIDSWFSVFSRTFPEHGRFGFTGGVGIERVTIVPALVYGIFGAFFAAIFLYAMGGLRGYSFLGGWLLSAFFAFGLHMVVAVIQGAIAAEQIHGGLRSWRRGAPQREAERLAERARSELEVREKRARAFVEHVILVGIDRRWHAPKRREKEQAQRAEEQLRRLAALELALEEAFNRYRFAHDVTGTADVNVLRQGFLRELQVNPLFSGEDMALISKSPNQQVRALLPPSTA